MDATDECPTVRADAVCQFPDPPVPFSLPYRGERLRWAIKMVGWSINLFAARMEMGEGTVRQMIANKRFIPDTLAYWMETLACVAVRDPRILDRLYISVPKPIGWRKKPDRSGTVDDENENELA
jgi:hypothetical protein